MIFPHFFLYAAQHRIPLVKSLIKDDVRTARIAEIHTPDYGCATLS
jgi:hypothetical protein